MAEAVELADFTGRDEDVDQPDDGETSFLSISDSDSTIIHDLEEAHEQLAGSDLEDLRRELLKTKVDAFLKAVADRDGLLPLGPLIYDEFVLGDDGRALYLKRTLKRVTWKNDSTKYLVLKSLGTVAFIRTYLFPDYSTARPTVQQIAAAQRAAWGVDDALQDIETIELQDLPHRASAASAAVDSAIAALGELAERETSFTAAAQLPMREILGLKEALKRTRGALVDNIAKLSQLDVDIAQAEQELGGEEATVDPEKKRRVQEFLARLRDERASRLEAASVNREALRSQFSRIRETIERILNEDTTLAERLRTLFREQGVTIASILTALGFIVSTIVLAIQNVFGGGGTPSPPAPAGQPGVADWVKKQLRTLAGWLKALAGKAAAALPGIIGAIVSWLLKTLGTVAVWFAEHLWTLAFALVVAAAMYLRDYRAR